MSTYDDTVLGTDELVRLERLFAIPPTSRLYRLYCRCGSTVETLETRALSVEEARRRILACRPGWVVDWVSEYTPAEWRVA